jgi:predicted transcriptional regulator
MTISSAKVTVHRDRARTITVSLPQSLETALDRLACVRREPRSRIITRILAAALVGERRDPSPKTREV